MDLRIRAIAIANEMTVLTRNTVDFEKIPNLAVEDWTTDPQLCRPCITSTQLCRRGGTSYRLALEFWRCPLNS
ncbi:MAG: hypothetical protein ACI8P0_003674 [Planctomycetaceae bacterium]|jgi:hypothetical protein